MFPAKIVNTLLTCNLSIKSSFELYKKSKKKVISEQKFTSLSLFKIYLFPFGAPKNDVTARSRVCQGFCKCIKKRDDGWRVSKIVQSCVTSFMDNPLIMINFADIWDW